MLIVAGILLAGVIGVLVYMQAAEAEALRAERPKNFGVVAIVDIPEKTDINVSGGGAVLTEEGVADGAGGMKIVQLFAPSDSPNYLGFSPRPTPKLIATYRTKGPALAISKGVDRDRAVDESGNQVAVFNRRGSRPLNKQEAERMYLRNGQVYTVTDAPPGPAR